MTASDLDRAVEAGGLSAEESRHVRMAVAAWLEGRHDAERWMNYIHVTLGSPTSEALKRSAVKAAGALKQKDQT